MSETSSEVLFGIEVEFYVGKIASLADHAEIRLKLATKLAELTKLPVACECTHYRDTSSCAVCKDVASNLLFDRGRIVSPKEPIHTADWLPDYQYFFVQHEALFQHGMSDDPVHPGMEISTPIFSQNELAAGLPKLEQIINALADTGMNVATGDMCGLHIHVGLKAGMTILFAKKLVTLVLLLERSLILALLPEKRRAGMWAKPIVEESLVALRGLVRGYWDDALKRPCSIMASNISLTRRNIKADEWNLPDPKHFYETMVLFWQSETLEDMSRNLRRLGTAKLGLALVLRDSPNAVKHEGTPSTFEFRYPQMDFSIAFIRNWAAIACRLCEIAKLDAPTFKNKTKTIHNVLSHKSSRPTWEALLTALDLGQQIPYWQGKIQSYGTKSP